METTAHGHLRLLGVFSVVYLVASLIHFVHNAVYLEQYPGLPASWTPIGVFLAWCGLTLVGAAGWLLLLRRRLFIGLSIVLVYAMLGMDSLGHYVVASVSAHTWMMNSTIVLEVTAASLVFLESGRLMVRRIAHLRFAREST